MDQLGDSISGQFDRLPPHSIEAEMCLLASMMLDKEICGQVVQIITGESVRQRRVVNVASEINDKTNGRKNGEMVSAAARPTMGKTAFEINVIENVSADGLLPGAFSAKKINKHK